MYHIMNKQIINKNPSSFSSSAAAAESSYIAAATKAIAADPKFQSALAVALASLMNNNGDGSSTQLAQGDRTTNLATKINWADLFPPSS